MKPLQPGDPAAVGNGRYRLTGRLGQGGMGVVYLGRSPSGRAVAVKVVRPELGTDPEFRRRFAQEVTAARRVGGFHTAPVVDADPDADPAWLVTAYVPGPSLAQVLIGYGPLPADTLTVLAAGLAEALEAIHRAGVIHRDLKPANIILAEDGPRVIDFGIARALDRTALTQTGLQIGTPGFLAPEQLTGGAVTSAVDVFALGVVLCRAAGASPYGDGPSASVLYRVVHEDPDLRGVPDFLVDAVAACLVRDPAARPAPRQLLDRIDVRRRDDGEWLPDGVRRMLADHTARPSGRTAQADPPEPVLPQTGPPVLGEAAGAAGEDVASLPTVKTAPGTARRAPAAATAGGAGPQQSGAAGQRHPVTERAVPDSGGNAVPEPVQPDRPRRRRLIAAAVAAAVAAGGAAAWLAIDPLHPGTGQVAAPPSPSPSTSVSRISPLADTLPTGPLLIRLDLSPVGKGPCHTVIGERATVTDRPTRLVADGTCDSLPQWAPDRGSFAFTRTSGSSSQVWVADADGTHARAVAPIAKGSRVSWSPDGSRLAALRVVGNVQQLVVITVATGETRQLTTGTDAIEDPAWKPQGARIAFCTRRTGGWQVYLLDPDHPDRAWTKVTDAPVRALDPAWSPDGTRLAYTSGRSGEGDIHVIGADGRGDRAVAATADQEMDPSWAPDGKWIAYVRGPLDQPHIWAVHPDGTGTRRLTTGDNREAHPAWR